MNLSLTKNCSGCGHPILWCYEKCVACETKPEGERAAIGAHVVLDGDGRPINVTAE